MHVHNVYFWLDDGLTGHELASFQEGLAALIQDPAVHAGFFGPPAETCRDVVDRSYSFGLVLVFEDQAAHDVYQTGSVHLRFVADHAAKWTRALVYDMQTG